jgi:multicomponent Na+:H+ antiporter subunit D
MSLKLYRIYPPELRSVHLDAQWVYRRLGPTVMLGTMRAIIRVDRRLRYTTLRLLKRGVMALAWHHRSEGVLARSWPTGSMVLWVAVLLGATLVLYYI